MVIWKGDEIGEEMSSPFQNYHTETCSCVLYIATNCNIVVFIVVCIYRYIQTTAFIIYNRCLKRKQNINFLKKTNLFCKSLEISKVVKIV